MKFSLLYKKFFLLPSPLRQEVMDFIEFLLQKYPESNQKNSIGLAEQRKKNFGRLKGKITMSPDFDDPVEGFEEYT